MLTLVVSTINGNKESGYLQAEGVAGVDIYI